MRREKHVKVLIVDDEKPARDRLRQLIADFGSHQVVAEATNGKQALSMAATHVPDVVLLDQSRCPVPRCVPVHPNALRDRLLVVRIEHDVLDDGER